MVRPPWSRPVRVCRRYIIFLYLLHPSFTHVFSSNPSSPTPRHVDSQVKARIVTIDAATKVVRLSLLPHVLRLSPPGPSLRHPRPLPAPGTVVEGGRVIRHDPGVGALIALPPPPATIIEEEDGDDDDEEEKKGEAKGEEEEEKNKNKKKKSEKKKEYEPNPRLLSDPTYESAASVRTAYVHISRAMDAPRSLSSSKKGGKGNSAAMTTSTTGGRTPEAVFSRRFAVGSIVPPLRILSQSHPMDDVAAGATAESVVRAGALSSWR